MLSTISAILPFHFSSYFSQPEKSVEIPFDDLRSLNDLTQFLTSEDCEISHWNEWKKEIKGFIQKYANDVDDLDQFLTAITAWGMKKDPQAMSAVIADMIGLDILTDVVRFKQSTSDIPFENIFDWAAEHAELCPAGVDQTLETHVSSEWKKVSSHCDLFHTESDQHLFGSF